VGPLDRIRAVSPDEHTVTRRQMIGGALAGGALIGTGGLLAACGGGGTPGPNSGGTSAARAGAGGTLRVGVAGGSAKRTVDAHRLTTDPEIARAFQLYEPLAIRNPDYELEMLLAESIEADQRPDRWTVRLREGIVFHDGRPVTADDVIFSIRRIVDPRAPKTGAASLAGVDLALTTKLDARTVRVALKAPNAGFPDELCQYFNGIVPRGYDPSRPVGTGPFRFQELTPGERSRFVRNPDYWSAGAPQLDEVVIVDYPDDRARVDALLGGDVDAITNVPTAQIDRVQGNPSFKLLTAETGAWQPFTMRVDTAPFDDVRVRQAMRLIVDREQMVGQALGRQGTPANDLYARYDPDYASDLPQRTQDLDQARSLLRQAGRSDLRVELVTSPVYKGIVEAAQVLRQQARGAGVDVAVREVDSDTFFGAGYLRWPFAQDFWFTRPYLAQVAQGSLKGSPFNETHWNHPGFVKLIEQARAELDAGRRGDLLRAAQAIEHEEGGYIVWSFSNQVDAYSAEVAGFQPAKSGVPLMNYGFARVGFAA
jgi:peptide/nickel transport system substrate-binding protein